VRLFITQPTYLPWLGIFKAIDLVDQFVFYNDVQYERKSWQNRNKIYNDTTGTELLITVPVKKQARETLIKDISISDPLFFERHLYLIKTNYRREPFVDEVVERLRDSYMQWHTKLANLNISLIQNLSDYLGIKTKFSRSSEYFIEGDKYTRPVKFAQFLGATEYLTQMGTAEYITQENFGDIKLLWLSVAPRNHLSIVDYLCRFGPNKTREIIHGL